MSAYVVLSAMISGIAASFFFIKKLKITFQYRAIIMASTLMGFVFFSLLQGVILVVTLYVQTYSWALIIVGACCGVFLIPITSLLMAYSSEVIYPLGEGSATGYLFAASQTFGFAIGMASISII
jgi:MFS family permease